MYQVKWLLVLCLYYELWYHVAFALGISPIFQFWFQCFPWSNKQWALIHELKTVKSPKPGTCPGTHNIPVSFQVSQWSCLQDGADRLTDLTPLEIERLLQFSKNIPGSTCLFPLNQYKSDDLMSEQHWLANLCLAFLCLFRVWALGHCWSEHSSLQLICGGHVPALGSTIHRESVSVQLM